MKANNYALILLWRGKELPDYLLEKIAEILTTNGVTVPELLKATYMDQEGIAQALVRDSENPSDTDINDTTTAINNAIVYIGERYKKFLSHKEHLNFALALSGDVNKANVNISFNANNISENDKALLNAVEILATNNFIITETAKKYYISKQVLDIIARVYNYGGIVAILLCTTASINRTRLFGIKPTNRDIRMQNHMFGKRTKIIVITKIKP